jgi:hypothetical protein
VAASAQTRDKLAMLAVRAWPESPRLTHLRQILAGLRQMGPSAGMSQGEPRAQDRVGQEDLGVHSYQSRTTGFKAKGDLSSTTV